MKWTLHFAGRGGGCARAPVLARSVTRIVQMSLNEAAHALTEAAPQAGQNHDHPCVRLDFCTGFFMVLHEGFRGTVWEECIRDLDDPRLAVCSCEIRELCEACGRESWGRWGASAGAYAWISAGARRGIAQLLPEFY